MSLDALADYMASEAGDSTHYKIVAEAEFLRRQTRAQIRSAFWMAVSVGVLALASVASLVVAIFRH
jgi:hypothetical protein